MRFTALLILVIAVFACGGGESSMPTPRADAAPSPPPAATPSTQSPASLAAPSAHAHADGIIDVAGIAMPMSDQWTQEQPTSSMRLAQYALPGSDGVATLAAFCFGLGQGGDVQSNISRWVNQFENTAAPGEPLEAAIEQVEPNGLEVTTVRCEGRFAPGAMGPMAPAPDPIEDAALFGVIIEGGAQGTIFIKVTGPRTTIDANLEALQAMVAGVHLGH